MQYKKKVTKKENNNGNIKFIIAIIFASLIMSVGYATINGVTMQISGTATLAENGNVEIVSVEKTSDFSNVTETGNPEINETKDGVTFHLRFTVTRSNSNQPFYAKYKIKIQNDSLYEHKVTSTTFTPNIQPASNAPGATLETTTLNGEQALNDTIPAGEYREYYVTIYFYPTTTGTWSSDGGTEIGTSENDDGLIMGTIPNNSTCDLTGTNEKCLITATVMNTHQGAKDFIFTQNSSNFTLVDANDNPLTSMNIAGETTDTYQFYIKRVSTAQFPSSTQKLNVNISNGDVSSMGIVTISVDADPTLSDDEAPIISNVTAEIRPNQDESYTDYKLYVSWTGSDNVGVNHYVVESYFSSTQNGTYQKFNTTQTQADETYVNVTGSNDGYYYFKVYGVDIANPANTASANEISSCPTEGDNLHCASSEKERFKWNFTVVITLNNAAITGKTASNGKVTYNVKYNESISDIEIKGTGDYSAPTGITNPKITYANSNTAETLGNDTNQAGYSYSRPSSSAGTLNIWKITGDITMTASGYSSCFVKGTKIMLANGKTKNIEDITYTDLLAVWNYDTGTLTVEYPLWIEKKQYSDLYQKITLSDGTILKVVGGHSFYNTDLNLFVNNLDRNTFNIGTHIAKINDNGEFQIVSVEKIETIHEDVEFYYVGSTKYYNIIANNILSTYQDPLISNLFGFTDKATWPKEKELIISNPENIVKYEDLQDVLPYYMYKGFRAGEVGHLINNNILTLDVFKAWIKDYVMKEDVLLKPIQKNNENYWMVTTSEDNVSEYNSSIYLKKEGSTYRLPASEHLNLKGWFNTADNKMYYPNDLIKVEHGLHFIAIYED